jgi:hypothetical protein
LVDTAGGDRFYKVASANNGDTIDAAGVSGTGNRFEHRAVTILMTTFFFA